MVQLMEIILVIEQLTKPLMAKLIKFKELLISSAIFLQGYLVLVSAIDFINSKFED
jgi:hypothetical protein